MKWVIWADYPANEMEIIVEPLYAAAQRSPAGSGPNIPCPRCHYSEGPQGAERYWEARWRDADKELTQLRTQVEQMRKALTASDDVIREVANRHNMETPDGRRISLGLAKIIADNTAVLGPISAVTSTDRPAVVRGDYHDGERD